MPFCCLLMSFSLLWAWPQTTFCWAWLRQYEEDPQDTKWWGNHFSRKFVTPTVAKSWDNLTETVQQMCSLPSGIMDIKANPHQNSCTMTKKFFCPSTNFSRNFPQELISTWNHRSREKVGFLFYTRQFFFQSNVNIVISKYPVISIKSLLLLSEYAGSILKV